jgi:light-regulated signal transduction histidine kinase (bacteriophytochrome)
MWDPAVIWLNVISDATIALAYYSIPLTLVYFVRKRKDLAFDWIFLCFAIFIVACGTTHLMEILNIWHPTYWLSGIIKAITAIVSIVTAILLIKLVPQALALPSPAQLRKSNEALQREILERTQAAAKVDSLNRELLQQTSKIAAANKELESFGYSISHDLRAPLRHIEGYVDLLREKTSVIGEEGERYMKIISDSTRHMGVLIDNLLAFAQMGKAAIQPSWIDTNALITQVRDELSPDTKGRTIEWIIEPLPQVYADKTLLKQVWMNLLGNAIKYTKNRDKAEISIGCKESPQGFEFHIKDNGAGFDMQYADKLFGIFQRLHFKEEFEGTGVGLAHVERIISKHGGRTWAHGEINVGATFYFTLPRKNPGH